MTKNQRRRQKHYAKTYTKINLAIKHNLTENLGWQYVDQIGVYIPPNVGYYNLVGFLSIHLKTELESEKSYDESFSA